MFLNKLRTEKIHGTSKKHVLTSPLKYVDFNGSAYVVPTNFETDLSTFYFEGRHTPSAVLHDYLIKNKVKSRKEADQIMLRAMRSKTEQCRWFNIFIVSVGLTVWRYLLAIKGMF